MNKPTKAVIAVAGYGTRRLPVAKAIEKCMLPILNRPVVDYIVQDVVKTGVKDIYFVVTGDARQLRDYYSRDIDLEEYLRAKGKTDLLAEIMPPSNVTFHFIEQDRNDSRYGTSVPVWLSRDYVKPDEHVYVIMGDQTLWRADGQSECQLLFTETEAAGADAGLIGVTVPNELVEMYGVIVQDSEKLFQKIVEHPKPEEAPSNLNNASVYLLPGSFMPYISAQMSQKVDGEYFIIDALNDFVADGNRTVVRTSDAEFLDCGNVPGWVAANVFLLNQANTLAV